NSGYASSFMNINPTIINAYLEFSFLHNKRALLRLQGFDLLDQNKNMGTYSEYVGNDLYEARNNRLGRYFMITLNLRLQKFPTDRYHDTDESHSDYKSRRSRCFTVAKPSCSCYRG